MEVMNTHMPISTPSTLLFLSQEKTAVKPTLIYLFPGCKALLL